MCVSYNLHRNVFLTNPYETAITNSVVVIVNNPMLSLAEGTYLADPERSSLVDLDDDTEKKMIYGPLLSFLCHCFKLS